MDDLLKEIKSLNDSLKRVADSLSPSFDTSVFDRFRAFKCSSHGEHLTIKGVESPDPVSFREMIGIDDIIGELKENTEQFLLGLPCNNVLLYGPRGTGKSSVIKALLSSYGDRGLKIIEMPTDTLLHIFDIADLLRARSDKFIIFCDDLSFEKDDHSFRRIKTVLEGGIDIRPSNMLIYATSNRRHLLPEKISDNMPSPSDELHPEDELEEKISLSDRFGLRLGFQNFDFDTYIKIVRNYAKVRGLTVDRDELKEMASEWSISHGSFSGRTARQFIDSLEGRIRLGKRLK